MRRLGPVLAGLGCAGSVVEEAPSPPQQATQAGAPRDPVVLDLGEGVTLSLVRIEAGTVVLGEGESRRAVVLERPYLLGQTELTNRAVQRWRPGWSPEHQKPEYDHLVSDGTITFDLPEQPALLTWLDAVAFASWASEQTGRTVRLPSEAEWEHAARAGTDSTFHWGEDTAGAPRFANVNDPVTHELLVLGDHGQPQDDVFPGADPHRGPAPVGSYSPNPWGLHDTVGNLMEWTLDRHVEDLALLPADGRPVPGSLEATDPGDPHVLKGGAFNSGPRMASEKTRNFCFAGAHFRTVGARVLVEL